MPGFQGRLFLVDSGICEGPAERIKTSSVITGVSPTSQPPEENREITADVLVVQLFSYYFCATKV